MFRYSALVFLLAVLPVAYNQFITFKDGKIGVNFFGFQAEAGLGGLLTGDAAHGGLSASANTPFGQRAAAGLGGTVDDQGRPRGGGFAAATAGAGLGASAALGGSLDEQGGRGGVGSEAHGAGYQAKKVEITQFPQQLTIPQNVKAIEFGPINPRISAEQDQSERRRLKAKYAQLQRDDQNKVKTISREIIRDDNSSKDENNVVRDRISMRRRKSSTAINSGAATTSRVNFQPNPNFFNDIFNIPISALNAVNQFLNNGLSGASVTKTKTKTVDYERN
ncbi:unnamed protein product [Chironomus riparius]|uniref:Uncharacterized protein n=1 Tax=Chironomus riparius TaxID=315576 RepID=A0A9P0IV85_9DIPT|nr:unnamed protein product [Chironomus riparius]